MILLKKKAVQLSSLFAGLIIAVTLMSGQDSMAAAAEVDFLVYLPFVSNPFQPGVPNFYVYLPIVSKPLPPLEGAEYDMVRFMAVAEPYGTLYEVQHSNGSQARHQTQTEAAKFFHTKGEPIAEWEELWYTGDYIYRGTDTSPGDANNDGRPDYYTLRENNQYGSMWVPRFWKVGDIFERNPIVTFYSKDNCSEWQSGYAQTWLKFEAFHAKYTFTSGITLNNVVQLAWLLGPNAAPTERYFYAEGYGLVGWESTDGHGFSYVSEIHAPGQRPNNTRDSIACINTSGWSLDELPKNLLPLPSELARYVK